MKLKSKKVLIYPFLLTAGLSFGLTAKEDTSRIQELEKRVASLESGKNSSGDVFDHAKKTLGIDIHGHLQFEYENFGSEGSRSGNSTFDNQYFTLWFGREIYEDLHVAVEIEYEHGGTSGQDGGTSGGGGGETEVDQAQVTWRPLSDETFKIRAGKFYAPFGIERFNYAGPHNRLVSRPSAFQRIYPGTYADTGLQTLGIVPFSNDMKFKYELAVVNGLGPSAASSIRSSRQGRDNNDNKAFVGRIAASFMNDAVEIGTSYYDGKYNSFQSLSHALVPDNELRLTYNGVDAQVRVDNFEFRGEWIESSVETGENAINGFRNFRRSGYYGQTAYRFDMDRSFINYLDAVVRLDSKDENSTVKDTADTRSWSFGINWGVTEDFVIKLQRQITHERGPEKLDNDAWLGQVSVKF